MLPSGIFVGGCERSHPQPSPSLLREDNSGALAWGTDSGSAKHGLYLARRIRFVQDAHLTGDIKLTKVPGTDNRADILTKVLSVKGLSSGHGSRGDGRWGRF